MKRMTLAETLIALADGATPDNPGVTVEEAHIDLPLVVAMEHGATGPVFIAHPPWSAFRSGMEPVAHRARLRIAGEPTAPVPEPHTPPSD